MNHFHPAPEPPVSHARSRRAADAERQLERGRHLPTLDGLRGVAVLLVMAFHFCDEPADGNRAVAVINALTRPGQFGVDLFFVLSGFLITGILLDTRESPHYFRNFYARRTLRIFPLYYGTLIVLYWVLPLFGVANWWPGWKESAAHQQWQWLYASNFAGVGLIAGHFWSLAVEEHFYLLWPLVVFLLMPRAMSWFCVGTILFALATRAWLTARGLDVFYLTPCRVDALAAGGLVATMARRPGVGLPYLLRWARWGMLGLGVVLVPLYLVSSGAHYPVMQTVKFTFIAAFFASVLTLCAAADPTCGSGRFWANPVLRTFGKYSYGLYVFHGVLLPFIDRFISSHRLVDWTHSLLAATILKLVIATAISFAIAWLSWQLYEKHFLRVKVFFETRRPPKPGQPGEAAAGAPIPLVTR